MYCYAFGIHCSSTVQSVQRGQQPSGSLSQIYNSAENGIPQGFPFQAGVLHQGHIPWTNLAGWNNSITFYIKKSSFSLCKRT